MKDKVSFLMRDKDINQMKDKNNLLKRENIMHMLVRMAFLSNYKFILMKKRC